MTFEEQLTLAKQMAQAALQTGRDAGLTEVDQLADVYTIIGLAAVALLAAQYAAAKAQGVPADMEGTIAWVAGFLRGYESSPLVRKQIGMLGAIINPRGAVHRN